MRFATASSELNGVHQILVILKPIPRSLGPWYLRLIHVLRDSLNIVTVLTWLSNTGRRLRRHNHYKFLPPQMNIFRLFSHSERVDLLEHCFALLVKTELIDARISRIQDYTTLSKPTWIFSVK